MNVAISHATVVTAGVMAALLANLTASVPGKGFVRRNASEVINATTMAVISLHALIRHQYQRSRYTAPVPALSSRTHCQPACMEASCAATMAAQITRKTVTNRETST